MKFLELLGELLLIYILYKVVFDFIIPIYQTTRQMKGKMNEMQEKMRQQQQNAATNINTEKQKQFTKPPAEDYIDYEEIKS